MMHHTTEQDRAGDGSPRGVYTIRAENRPLRGPEASRCVSAGRCASARYTPDNSIALMRLLENIRKDWGMVFSCEEK